MSTVRALTRALPKTALRATFPAVCAACAAASRRALLFKTAGPFAGFPARAPFHNTAAVRSAALELSRDDYVRLSDLAMEAVYESLDEFADDNVGADVEYASGVLTLTLPNNEGTYVINKQPPNKQIWLSSPKSGPFQYRYDTESGEWVDIRGSGKTLSSLLNEELDVEITMDA